MSCCVVQQLSQLLQSENHSYKQEKCAVHYKQMKSALHGNEPRLTNAALSCEGPSLHFRVYHCVVSKLRQEAPHLSLPPCGNFE